MTNLATLPDNTVIQVSIGDLRNLLKEIAKPTSQWITTTEFKKIHNKTEDQMKYMRKQHPTWFKLNDLRTRWLIDTKQYHKQSA